MPEQEKKKTTYNNRITIQKRDNPIQGKNKINQRKNKTTQAAALKYSPESTKAPVIVAMGKGETAKNIIELAEKSNVPLYRDENLVNALSQFDLGDEIPPELYKIVAEILIFVNKVDKSYIK